MDKPSQLGPMGVQFVHPKYYEQHVAHGLLAGAQKGMGVGNELRDSLERNHGWDVL